MGFWATIRFYSQFRKDRRYMLIHLWEHRVVWALIRIIPRDVKKFIVVQAAVRASKGNSPDVIKYSEMYDVYASPTERPKENKSS